MHGMLSPGIVENTKISIVQEFCNIQLLSDLPRCNIIIDCMKSTMQGQLYLPVVYLSRDRTRDYYDHVSENGGGKFRI